MVSSNVSSLKDESNTEGVRSVQKDFIGKEALLKQKHEGVKQRLCMFELEDIDPDKDIWPWGNEPIYRNGQFVGTVTSSGYVADASQPLLVERFYLINLRNIKHFVLTYYSFTCCSFTQEYFPHKYCLVNNLVGTLSNHSLA